MSEGICKSTFGTWHWPKGGSRKFWCKVLSVTRLLWSALFKFHINCYNLIATKRSKVSGTNPENDSCPNVPQLGMLPWCCEERNVPSDVPEVPSCPIRFVVGQGYIEHLISEKNSYFGL